MSTGIIRDTFHFRQINVSEPMLKEAPVGTLDASRGPTMLIMVHIVRKLRWQRRGFFHFIILKIFHKHRNSFTILGLCRDIFLVPCAFSKIWKQAENQTVWGIIPNPSGWTFWRHKAPNKDAYRGCVFHSATLSPLVSSSQTFRLQVKVLCSMPTLFQNRQDLLQ